MPLGYGTIISDVEATFSLQESVISVMLMLAILIFIVSFVSSILVIRPVSASGAPRDTSGRLALISGAAAVFPFVSALLFLLASSVYLFYHHPVFDEDNADDAQYYEVSFVDAVQAEFGEDVDVRTVGTDGELISGASLGADAYDTEKGEYSAEAVIADMTGFDINRYEVVISYDGTVSFTELEGESD